MINQHVQTETLPGEVATVIAELQDFIAACRDARDVRKANELNQGLSPEQWKIHCER